MKTPLTTQNEIYKQIQDFKLEKEQIKLQTQEQYQLLIESLSNELGIKVGDKILLNQYEKEVVIHKFEISYSYRYSHADSFKEYLTEEEYIEHKSKKFALWAECYDVNKNGKINKKIQPCYNRYCLEDIDKIEDN